jgi:hypothetical protein
MKQLHYKSCFFFLENSTDDDVELAFGFLKQCDQKL